ncbi:MAG: hypothetical protein EKK46_06650 [Rhodocyclaceae bacterium]|nr:MAG: hypothetical protein EKK46_06650 [Rhodocyclaceae bacterium]
MTIDLSAFQEMEFPQHRDIVYVFHYLTDNATEPVPFYVGESSRHVGRFGDYMSANFSASTDFKVGEAVKYLRKRGARILVKFKETHDRREDEKLLLHKLRRSVRLLNDLKGYRYGEADIDDERLKIHRFIDEILTPAETTKPAPQPRIRKQAPSNAPPPNRNPLSELSVPERIRLICQELAAGDKIIRRKDILRLAKERGINEGSVLPADYCDNTETGKWSKHSFLHSVGPGRYVLR